MFLWRSQANLRGSYLGFFMSRQSQEHPASGLTYSIFSLPDSSTSIRFTLILQTKRRSRSLPLTRPSSSLNQPTPNTAFFVAFAGEALTTTHLLYLTIKLIDCPTCPGPSIFCCALGIFAVTFQFRIDLVRARLGISNQVVHLLACLSLQCLGVLLHFLTASGKVGLHFA